MLATLPMATLTAKQRNALPDSAFVYRKARKYPVPTKAQAQRAGISEKKRQRLHRAALSYSAQRKTAGTPGRVRSVVRKRSGGKIASLRKRSAPTVRRRRRPTSRRK
jgi:protoporphyrinogen oxidase